MNIKGQSHSLTFVQGHSDSTFSNSFSLETPWPNEAKLHVEPPWDGVMKFCSKGPDHITKMAVMAMCNKNLKNPLSLELSSSGYSSTTKLIQMITMG